MNYSAQYHVVPATFHVISRKVDYLWDSEDGVFFRIAHPNYPSVYPIVPRKSNRKCWIDEKCQSVEERLERGKMSGYTEKQQEIFTLLDNVRGPHCQKMSDVYTVRKCQISTLIDNIRGPQNTVFRGLHCQKLQRSTLLENVRGLDCQKMSEVYAVRKFQRSTLLENV